MKNIIVTGSDGFIGRNLILALRRLEGINVYSYDINDHINSLKEAVKGADIIFHLAGVNRPEKTEEYEAGNVGFTRMLISMVEESKVKPLIIFSSSIQAALDNPYGLSKRKAEEELIDWAKRSESAVVIYRLPNVFGKWCRPNYNSAVATFCHNLARDFEVHIIDPKRVVELVYIDDVVKAFLDNIKDKPENGVYYNNVTPVFKVTVKKLVEIIKGFKNTRSDLTIPDFSDPFIKRLYATYLSYLPQDKFAYQPEIKIDNRGILAELLKSQASGQIFVSRTKPGITRGNHFHDTKVEKFCVLDGEAIIRFRDVRGKDVIEYQVSGKKITIVDIPPGYTHSIENIGQKELIVLFWANEIYDPENPDTHRLEVINEEN